MDYVFVFVGEFGYELLNWQGRVRRFAKTLSGTDRIFLSGRRGVELLYEYATNYVALTDFGPYQDSRASGYFFAPPDTGIISRETADFLSGVKGPLADYVRDQLAIRHSVSLADDARFVYSFERTSIGEHTFGLSLRDFGPLLKEDIYSLLPYNENDYVQLLPEPHIVSKVLARAGLQPGEPFVLCQSRYRNEEGEPRIDVQAILESVAAETRVVFLQFATDRSTDSFSTMEMSKGITTLQIGSLEEQIAIIAAASTCLFFTEGDFGSHIYIPPLVGKNVDVICHDHILRKGTTPIQLWNHTVFRFGGNIRLNPIVNASAEKTNSYVRTTEVAADNLLSQVQQRKYLDGVASKFSPTLFPEMYLWPNTPISAAIQTRIEERVGASDRDPSIVGSRPFRIINAVRQAINFGFFDPCLSIIDVACGDALILKHLQDEFPTAHCFGLDCNAGKFDAHVDAKASGVTLTAGFLQHLVQDGPARPFDLVLMLNTYRDWNAAQLRPEHRALPQQMDAWLERFSRAAILTVTRGQLDVMRKRGWNARELGPGEDASIMVFVQFAPSAVAKALSPPRHVLVSGLGTAHFPETHPEQWSGANDAFKAAYLDALSRGGSRSLVRKNSTSMQRVFSEMLKDYARYKEAFRMEVMHKAEGNRSEVLRARAPERLAVMGFGRSGTSFVMEFLEHCGIFIDETNWAKEHEFLRFIDDTIFAQNFGVTPGLPYGNIPDKEIYFSDEKKRLATFFVRYMDSRCLEQRQRAWAAKDPRMTVLNTLWTPHFDRFIIVFRRPDEVARSYINRGWIKGDNATEVALKYWVRFNQAALRVYQSMAQTQSVAVVNFDGNIVDKLAHIGEAFGYSTAAARKAVSYDESRSVDRPLDVPESVARVYAELCCLEEVTLTLGDKRVL